MLQEQINETAQMMMRDPILSRIVIVNQNSDQPKLPPTQLVSYSNLGTVFQLTTNDVGRPGGRINLINFEEIEGQLLKEYEHEILSDLLSKADELKIVKETPAE